MKLHNEFCFTWEYPLYSITKHMSLFHDFAKFSINAKHFQLFEGKSKKPRLFCGPAKNLRGPVIENH